jgi:Mn2+/Fe2+ NRAMP family transporter
MIPLQGIIPVSRHAFEVQGCDPHLLFCHGTHPTEIRLALVEPRQQVSLPIERWEVELGATVAAILVTVAIISTTLSTVVLRSAVEVAAAASTTSTLAAKSTARTAVVASSAVATARAAGVDVAFAGRAHGATAARAGVVTRAPTGEVQVRCAGSGIDRRFLQGRLPCVSSRLLTVVTCARSDVC